MIDTVEFHFTGNELGKYFQKDFKGKPGAEWHRTSLDRTPFRAYKIPFIWGHAWLGWSKGSPQPYFVIQAELGKVLNGHNIHLLDYAAVEAALQEAVLTVQVKTENLELPVYTEWTLKRVDWFWQWDVSEPDAYLRVVHRNAPYNFRHRKTEIQKGAGHTISMEVKDWKWRIYNKDAQVKDKYKPTSDGFVKGHGNRLRYDELTEAASNLLRFEFMARGEHLKKVMRLNRAVKINDLLNQLHDQGAIVIAQKWGEVTAGWHETEPEEVFRRLLASVSSTGTADLGTRLRLYQFWLHSHLIGLDAMIRLTEAPSHSKWVRRQVAGLKKYLGNDCFVIGNYEQLPRLKIP